MIEIKRSHLIAATAVPLGILAVAMALVVGRGRAPAPPAIEPEAPRTADRGAGSAARQEASKRLEPDGTKALAVVADGMDPIGSTLDALGEGYRYETIDDEALADAKALARYQAVFLPSGDPAGEPEGLPKALQDYVGGGGTLYASDLRYDAVASAFPEVVDHASVAQGVPQDARAEVTSPELREWLGPEVTLHFKSERWRPAAFRGPDVAVLLRGRLKTTAGVAIDAPLAVRIAVGRGSVIFTSFHATGRPGEVESKLMKYLVLKAVTAGSEARVVESLSDDGFTEAAAWATGADAGSTPASHEYQHAGRGPLRFRLEPARPGARLRLEVNDPAGKVTRKEGESTLAIDVPEAEAGRWQVRSSVESAPYRAFAAVAVVGVPVAAGGTSSGTNQGVAGRSANVRFQRVSLNKPAAAKQRRPLRIAVTRPQFDDMGKLLDALGAGYRYTVVENDAVLRPAALDPFDILFLTCGAWPIEWGARSGGVVREGVTYGEMRPDNLERLRQTLRRFVERGGTIYASDLRGGLLRRAFPERAPAADFDPRGLREVEEIEKRWLKAVAPSASIGTVAQTLDQLTLSNSLRGRRDELVALISSSILVKFNRAETDPDDLTSIRQRVVRHGLPVTERDCEILAEQFGRRREVLRESFNARSRTKIRKSLGELNKVDAQLRAARERLIIDHDGAGRQDVDARVVDSGLREVIGDTIHLRFPDNSWIPAQLVGDMQVLIRGTYVAIGRQTFEAPLLARFRQGKGTIIFTSFHNEAQNNQQELELLRYVVFSAVTAKEEVAAQETMLSGGFSPVKQGQVNRATGKDSITRGFKSDSGDPLRFSLNFGGGGAVLRLKLVAPGGSSHDEEADESMVVEARGAPAGEWLYTVTAVKVPHENFAYSVSIGKGSPGPTRKGR